MLEILKTTKRGTEQRGCLYGGEPAILIGLALGAILTSNPGQLTTVTFLFSCLDEPGLVVT